MPTINVSTLDELYQQLANATGGETILLSGGNYGDFSLSAKSGFDFTYPDNVTIASADPANPAIFSSVDVRGAGNLTFDGVTFDYEFETGDEIYYRPFSFTDSTNITIRNSTFDGDVASGVSEASDGYGYAIGLSVRGSSSVTVENNEVFNFFRGMTISESDGISVLRNEVHSIRMDGMNFSEVADVLIEANYIHDFRGSPKSNDHSDMIQFWTNGTESPSTDIVIRGNQLDIGAGTPTQSIFMRNDLVDRGLAGEEMFYQNVSITDNVIVNGHLHGITVGETDGLTINQNTVLHADGGNRDGADSTVEIPRINVSAGSKDVSIVGNVTFAVDGWDKQPDWVLSKNVLVQDQNSAAPGYYGDVFVASSLQLVDGQHNFIAMPDGQLYAAKAGAVATRKTTTDLDVEAQFHVLDNKENDAQRTFDASLTLSALGDLPEGTQFQWNFGDGTSATGILAAHTYAEGGAYNVTLTVKLPNGAEDSLVVPVQIAGAKLLSMNENGNFIAHEAGAEILLPGSDGITLEKSGIAASIDRTHIERLLQSDEFKINISLEATRSNSWGEVFRLHGSLLAEVDRDGNLVLRVSEADGGIVRLSTNGAMLNDGASHDISISLLDGRLTVSIDNKTQVSTVFTDTLASNGTHDLVFGNPWTKQNFVGKISDFDITTNAGDYKAGISTLGASQEKVVPKHDEGIPQTDGILDQDAPDAGPIQLGTTGTVASIERELIRELPGADEFNINLTLTADNASSTGEVFRLHGSLIASINEAGELLVRAFPEVGGEIRLGTLNARLNDQISHDITISLKNGLLSIAVDEAAAVTIEFTGSLGDFGSHNLVFGNPWGQQNFTGEISAFDISAEREGYGADGMSYVPMQVDVLSVINATVMETTLEVVKEAPEVVFQQLENDSNSSIAPSFDSSGNTTSHAPIDKMEVMIESAAVVWADM